jgi:TPP-dependent pyruvate/acetoin dehydrogenase alpha subunit
MQKKEYLEMYYQMVLIRRLEEKAAELYQQGKIGGFLHLYIGQEAVSTGLISRRPQDRSSPHTGTTASPSMPGYLPEKRWLSC